MSGSKCTCTQEEVKKEVNIGVFTSGGDSQGMNAAIRAIVRCGLYKGCNIYLIRNGYQGMIEGGESIEKATWNSVSKIIHMGGTVIGAGRCVEFLERSTRLKCALTLVKIGITNLIPIGGDGTLTGANIFQNEWPELLDELVANGEISEEMRDSNNCLNVAGLIGSIDNDFCGTDWAIGTDTALTRILEGVDSIRDTAEAMQRTFIIEVMGRYCGFLGIIGSIITQSVYAFIPESPPPKNWRDELCEKLLQERCCGSRYDIITVAEGAHDLNGVAITCKDIQQLIEQRFPHGARVNVLGHTQRGGTTSCLDRELASRFAEDAVNFLLEAAANSNNESVVICLNGNKIIRKPLTQSIIDTQSITKAIKDKDWDKTLTLRGQHFKNCLEIMNKMIRLQPCTCSQMKMNIAIMHVGLPASGMNAATAAFARGCICEGFVLFAIHDGVDGLINGVIKELEWGDMNGWVCEAGSKLGCNCTLPHGNFDKCANSLKQFNIKGLLIIGGFDAFLLALHLMGERKKFNEFCIPIMVLPATIANNVPGSQFSIGADTCVSTITNFCDQFHALADSLKRQVYIMETMGDCCGYLATLCGITASADAAYIFEENFNVFDILKDIKNVKIKLNSGIERGLILRSSKASENYSTEVIYKIFDEESNGIFKSNSEKIGDVQMSGRPTPTDRLFACDLATIGVKWFKEQLSKKRGSTHLFKSYKSIVVGGLVWDEQKITPIQELIADTDFEHRIPKEQWWLKLRPLMKILTTHIDAYEKSQEEDEK